MFMRRQVAGAAARRPPAVAVASAFLAVGFFVRSARDQLQSRIIVATQRPVGQPRRVALPDVGFLLRSAHDESENGFVVATVRRADKARRRLSS